jgi:hypothetical protein
MAEEIARDFFARDLEEQNAFLTQTWCNQCMEADLGMTNPREYELNGIVFVEGQCTQCKSPVFTELTDEEL